MRIFKTALVLLVLAAPVQAQQATPRQIIVTGEGQVDVAPDMAVISLGVTHQDKVARDAMAATSDAVSAVLARLEASGIEARDIQTRNLTIRPVWPDYSASSSGTAQIAGFVATNTVTVRVRKLEDLGGILEAILEDGANEFNGLEFTVQEPDPLMDQARKLAVADAMSTAKLLAEAAGVTLGPVQSLSDNSGGGRPVMMEMSAARGKSVPVAGGEVSVNASVSMVFGIND